MIRSFLAIIFTLVVSVSAFGAAEESFGGIGLQVVPTINGNLVILNVLKDSPAEQKGLQPGDLVFQVDSFVLQGSDFGKVISEYLWGVVGSPVVLHYRRPGMSGNRRVKVIRTSMDPRLTVTPSVQDAGNESRESQR